MKGMKRITLLSEPGSLVWNPQSVLDCISKMAKPASLIQSGQEPQGFLLMTSLSLEQHMLRQTTAFAFSSESPARLTV